MDVWLLSRIESLQVLLTFDLDLDLDCDSIAFQVSSVLREKLTSFGWIKYNNKVHLIYLIISAWMEENGSNYRHLLSLKEPVDLK